MPLSIDSCFVKAMFLGLAFIPSYKALSCTDTLKVGVEEKWPPYSYLENGVYKGLDIEIIELILSKANFCWKYSSYPSTARTFKELENNRIDLLFAASRNKQREAYASFSLPYRTETMIIFSHKGQPERFNFNTKHTVTVNRGSFYGELFTDYRAKCKDCVVELNSTKQRFVLLQNKRVQFSIEDELTGSYILQHENFDDLTKHVDSVIHNNKVHYMFGLTAKGDMVRERLNIAIKELDSDINKIIHSYKVNLHNTNVGVQ